MFGNWQDVALWSIGALQPSRRCAPTVDARFDVFGCVLRLAEAAIVLFNASWDAAWVRSAAEGVNVARDIEPDSAIDQVAAQLAAILVAERLPPSAPPAAKSRRVSTPAGAPATVASDARACNRMAETR